MDKNNVRLYETFFVRTLPVLFFEKVKRRTEHNLVERILPAPEQHLSSKHNKAKFLRDSCNYFYLFEL
jgi:hypothetical protein